jgi:RNA-binding protein NOB1
MPESAELKLSKPVNVAGFYVPPKKSNNKTTSESENESKQDENNKVDETETVATAVAELSVNEKAAEKKEEQEKEEQESGDEEEEEEEEDEEEDDGGEWITPGNIEEIKKMSQVDSDRLEVNESNRIKVGCMTSDFAMQNVLIQIGIPVLSVDGLIIKVARSYVLRCMTCMR